MTEVTIVETMLVARFAPWTRPLLLRSEVRVPLAAIRSVTVLDRPLAAVHGLRAGLNVSGFVKVGTWKTLAGVKQLVCARRNMPALRIVLDRPAAGANLDELILSVPDAAALRSRIVGVPA